MFRTCIEIQPDHAASSKHLKLLEKQQQQQHSASRATTNEYRQLVRVFFFTSPSLLSCNTHFKTQAMMVFPEHEMREQIGGVLNIDDGNETMNSMVRVSHFLFNYSEDSVV